MPVDLEPLHERIVDRHDVGGDGPVIRFDVSDLQPLVVEANKLCAEIAAYVFGQNSATRTSRPCRPASCQDPCRHGSSSISFLAPPAKPLFLGQ